MKANRNFGRAFFFYFSPSPALCQISHTFRQSSTTLLKSRQQTPNHRKIPHMRKNCTAILGDGCRQLATPRTHSAHGSVPILPKRPGSYPRRRQRNRGKVLIYLRKKVRQPGVPIHARFSKICGLSRESPILFSQTQPGKMMKERNQPDS